MKRKFLRLIVKCALNVCLCLCLFCPSAIPALGDTFWVCITWIGFRYGTPQRRCPMHCINKRLLELAFLRFGPDSAKWVLHVTATALRLVVNLHRWAQQSCASERVRYLWHEYQTEQTKNTTSQKRKTFLFLKNPVLNCVWVRSCVTSAWKLEGGGRVSTFSAFESRVRALL